MYIDFIDAEDDGSFEAEVTGLVGDGFYTGTLASEQIDEDILNQSEDNPVVVFIRCINGEPDKYWTTSYPNLGDSPSYSQYEVVDAAVSHER